MVPTVFNIIAVVNVLAFMAFGIDKLLAKAGMRRLSEGFLLLVSFLGGSAGAALSMAIFRHKTSKGRFATGVPLMLVVHAQVLVVMFFKYQE